MNYFLTIILTLLISLFFFLAYHPLAMIIILILLTTSIALNLSSSLSSSWFSFIITLILIGAMLVIFIYLASLAPNEKFFHNTSLKLILLPPIIILYQFIPNHHPSSPNPTLTFQLFSNLPMTPNLLLATLLFITMLSVVKITSLSEGPLKSF
uniref:NADH dehydrogenase subunit 6 n=1 Tax=Heterophrynus longicornis TaxID=1046789 RepID=UPI0024112BED|nr:NADH dehydrogenase subunit 6 [Heterophrynus longicornis]WEM34680.1 NADH dehydrogenase subunit 6 [Heterophrynus longicornis]